jgi:hypothetical protein
MLEFAGMLEGNAHPNSQVSREVSQLYVHD